ncbi:MAG: PqqD family protein [Actinomycetota bacterium]
MIQSGDAAVRHAGALFRVLDGETVLYHAETGASMLLDPMGSLIWACFEQPVSVEDLSIELADEFEAPAAVIASHVLQLARQLESDGFLTALASEES